MCKAGISREKVIPLYGRGSTSQQDPRYGQIHVHCFSVVFHRRFYWFIIPPEQRSCWGVYWFHSVRPSVRLSRLLCPLCNIYSSGWILSILATNDHYHERVCRTQDLWPWPISWRSFGLDLENRVRSVASTVQDGFLLYLAQMITIIRGCVACYVFFRIWKFKF